MTRELTDQVREGLGLPADLGLHVATFGAEAPPRLSIDAWPSLASSAPKRRHEFLWGRLSARKALSAAGCDLDAPLPVGTDRAPQWPQGWTGSISHAAGVAAALAGRKRDHPWMGLDVEGLTSLNHMEEIGDLVVTPSERARLSRAEDLLATFSGKETVFKALRPGRLLDFNAAELFALDDATLTFRLTLDWSTLWLAGSLIQVRRFEADRWIFTAAIPEPFSAPSEAPR